MKISATISDRTPTVIDVDFPIFRRHDLDGCTIYMMVEGPTKEWSIKEDDTRRAYEIDVEHPSWFADLDYLLGRAKHESNAKEFNDALNRAKTFLASVPSEARQ